MIKLQLLLRRPSTDIALDPLVRAALEQLGFAVTGAGRATVSAELTEERFAQLFGPAAPAANLTLPLPVSLADAISLITIAPRHSALRHTPRVHHAAM